MFNKPAELDSLYVGSLPAEHCHACRTVIRPRYQRVWIRATWRPGRETLCVPCWKFICDWAKRFALQQGLLPDF